MPRAISTGDTLPFDSLLWTGPQVLRGSSTVALQISGECAVARSGGWSGGNFCLSTWHATLLCLYIRVCNVRVVPAAFVSVMLHRAYCRAWTGQQYCIWCVIHPGLFASNFLFVSGIINELKAGWQWGGFTARCDCAGACCAMGCAHAALLA